MIKHGKLIIWTTNQASDKINWEKRKKSQINTGKI